MISWVRPTAARIASTEIVVVGAAVSAGFFSTRLLLVVLAIAAAYWPIRLIAFGSISRRTPIDWAIFSLLVTLPIALLISPVPSEAMVQAVRLLVGIAFFYSIVNWTSSTIRLRMLLNGLACGMLFLAIITPIVVFPLSQKGILFLRPLTNIRLAFLTTESVNPNVMAGSLVLLFPFPTLYALYFWRSVKWIENILMLTTSVVSLVMIILLQSRGALLGIAVGTITVIIVIAKFKKLLVTVMIMIGLLVARLVGYTELATIGSSVVGLANRQEIWGRALYMIIDHPLVGIGMAGFPVVLESSYAQLNIGLVQPHAHNLVLQITVDLGIPGLIAWLSVVLTITCAAWEVLSESKVRRDQSLRGIGVATLCSQIAYLVHGLIDAVTWGMVRTAIIPWAIWGIVVAALYIKRAEVIIDNNQEENS